MGQRYLIDSNVIIDYTTNIFPSGASEFVEQVFNKDFSISVIVKIEVLGFNDEPAKLEGLEEFLKTASVIPLDDEVIQQTILLRRQHKIKLGDAIIAATAILNGLTLLTRNISDFKNVNDLQIVNPWNL